MLSIISLLVVLTLSILVTRVATVALTYTGLSRESARFQSRSAFTGVGFTTSESENVVNHPLRRKILMLLMLLGNAGVITAVSSLIVSFVNVEGSTTLFWQVALMVTGIVGLWTLANSSWVDRHLSNLIARGLKSLTSITIQDYSSMLRLSGDYQISEVHVSAGHWLEDRTIGSAALRHEGITVLGIDRAGGAYMGAPDGDTKIHQEDTLIVYGRATLIKDLCDRDSGLDGNAEHRRNIVDEQINRNFQKRQDESAEKDAAEQRNEPT
jgi:hypothetical protein